MITHNTDGYRAKGEGVLITGCSSGIGRTTAIALAQHGFTVFATVRKQADAEALRGLHEPNLIPVCPLDLTHLEQIPAVVEVVTSKLEQFGQKGLFAVINNAGGGRVAPIELMNLDQFRVELEARLLGAVAMLQAFLPLIRQGGGRILWVTTPATIPTQYVTSIHACDFAVNCIARTLGIELKAWNIPVSMIRCGGIKTRAGLDTTVEVEALLKEGPRERVALYQPALQAWGKEMAGFDEKRTEPTKVADLILKALAARSPKPRYSTGYMAGPAAFLEALPQPVTDWILKIRH